MVEFWWLMALKVEKNYTTHMQFVFSFSAHNFYFWIPIVGPLIGAVVGAAVYQLCVGLHGTSEDKEDTDSTASSLPEKYNVNLSIGN